MLFKMKRIVLLLLTIATITVNSQNFIWSAQNSGVETTLNDVYFIDNQNGWAVGTNGVILKTSDGGLVWSAQQSGVTAELRAVYFIDENNGYTVGGLGNIGPGANVVLKTTDAGSTWTTMSVGNPNFGYQDVAFSSINHGIIIAGDSIYATADAGANWIKEDYVAEVSGTSFNKAVASFNDSVSLIGGDRNNPNLSGKKGEIFDRRLWNAPYIWGTTAASQIDISDRIFSLEVASPSYAFAGGQNGKVYRMNTDQINYNGPWTVSLDLDPNSLQIIGSISFPTADLGMVLTDATINSIDYALVYYTFDLGAIWSSVPDTISTGSIWSIDAPTPNEAWAVGSGGKIYKGTRTNSAVNQMSLNIDVSLYPNPTTDIINIVMNSKNNELVNYSLTDVTGRIIDHGSWSLSSANSRFTLNVSKTNNGVYFLKLYTQERQGTFRILKN